MPFSGGLGSRSRAGVVQGMRGGRSAAQRPDAGAGCRRPPEPSPAAPAGRGDSLRSRFLRRLRAALARAGRRSLPAALLLALAPSFALPLALPASAQEVVEVPRGWPLKPSGLSSTQTEFRLLFVTSTTRNAASTNIADYNRFVQGRAAAGHASIRSFSSKFRVVGSTGAVHARDNTSNDLHVFGQGRADLVAERRQGRGPLRGFLRRQLGQRERKERARRCSEGRLLWGRAPDVVDRDQQQWHRRLSSRVWRVFG